MRPTFEPRCVECGGTGFLGDKPCEASTATARDTQAPDTPSGFADVLDVRAAIARYNGWSDTEQRKLSIPDQFDR